jgi:hypothetical protein
MDIVQTQELVQLTAGNLRLEFSRQPDRWRHVVLVQTAMTGWQPWWESREGATDDPNPASPALQDCFLQEIDAGTQEVQLLGQAGKNVYSAAIRFGGERQEIDFDLCLRLPASAGVPEILSTYQTTRTDSLCTELDESERVCLLRESTGQVLEIVLLTPLESKVPGSQLRLDRSAQRLEIPGAAAEGTPSGTSRRSFRWRYRLRLIKLA